MYTQTLTTWDGITYTAELVPASNEWRVTGPEGLQIIHHVDAWHAVSAYRSALGY